MCIGWSCPKRGIGSLWSSIVLNPFLYRSNKLCENSQKKNDVIGVINTKEMLTDSAAGRTNDVTSFIHDILQIKIRLLLKMYS
ncbi:hypothetical protein AEA09_03985 [Lysinibacillus contaminans]|uniref:Uncharacterized protein n=1 Tax=Lysinibacillus contaminans TaxID=1293441 RepID=A0ABR5JYT9_9BACI|nr:hypothetical protein AEA09_03985 [Lysinibacillus contaminans]